MGKTQRRACGALAACLIAGLCGSGHTVPAEAPAAASRAERQGASVEFAPDGARITAGFPQTVDIGLGDSDVSPVEIGGLWLPAHLIALDVTGSDASVDANRLVSIMGMESAPYAGAPVLPVADVTADSRAAFDEYGQLQDRAGLAITPTTVLPESPVVILRLGNWRGTRVAVLALTPVFTQTGGLRWATHLDLFVPGARRFDAALDRGMFAPGPPPVNAASAGQAWTITVTVAGMQRITGQMLANAGLDIARTVPGLIHVRWRAGEAALQEIGTDDGRLDGSDELRFYASQPGDRWNSAEIYWLTVEVTRGLRMSDRASPPVSAPVRDTALESGVWRQAAKYDSLLPGPDGDHWFGYELRTDPFAVPPYGTNVNVSVTTALPLASGIGAITVTGSAITAGQHRIEVALGAAASSADWQGAGDWTAALTSDDPALAARLRLVPQSGYDGVLVDAIEWRRPVQLDFAAGSAGFEGAAGMWAYRLRNTTNGAIVYDITDPLRPAVLRPAPGTSDTYQDGPSPRRYWLANPAQVQAPPVAAHTGVDFSPPLNADAVYIAPAAFQPALLPLTALRQAQGHAVRIVDVQDVYDAWSFGQVSPDAIRDFLRYAAGQPSSRVLRAAILVGDGTYDPLGHAAGQTRGVNIIPPYLAMVDPWLGETACDTCYGQLDGADPLSDALPDLEIGRLPVKDEAGLRDVVAKLARYESARSGIWRARNVFLADNFRQPIRDATGTIIDWRMDAAGDFAAISDGAIREQPAELLIRRLYYDPYPATSAGISWREPNALAAHVRAAALIDDGAATVNYIGHADASQLAYTDATAGSAVNYLIGSSDPASMTNGDRLPLMLEWTCLTSAFHTPLNGGSSIDERFLLAPGGGAAGVWGSSGLGVTHGHDVLQRGFYAAVWAAEKARFVDVGVGRLTLAGFVELFTRGNCCQDLLRTFVLLGDPLAHLRVVIPQSIYLPVISHLRVVAPQSAYLPIIMRLR